MKTTESSYTEVPVTEIKPQLTEGKAAILGFQHLLAMYSGDVIVPLLIGGFLHFTAAQMTYLVSVDIFMCGIATLLQIKRTPLTGIGLPSRPTPPANWRDSRGHRHVRSNYRFW